MFILQPAPHSQPTSPAAALYKLPCCQAHPPSNTKPPPPHPTPASAPAPQVLNLLLYGLRRQEPDAALLAFLVVDEQLVDIGDDLTDYEVGLSCVLCAGAVCRCRCRCTTG